MILGQPSDQIQSSYNLYIAKSSRLSKAQPINVIAAALKWSTSLFEVETQETAKSMQINHLDWVSFKGGRDLLVTADALLNSI